MFVESRISQFARLSLREIVRTGISDCFGRSVLRFGDDLLLCLPLLHFLIRLRPIARLERLSNLLLANKSVNPNWTAAAPITPSFTAMLAAFSVATIDRQHGAPSFLC